MNGPQIISFLEGGKGLDLDLDRRVLGDLVGPDLLANLMKCI
jgi:hypothetical protein